MRLFLVVPTLMCAACGGAEFTRVDDLVHAADAGVDGDPSFDGGGEVFRDAGGDLNAVDAVATDAPSDVCTPPVDQSTVCTFGGPLSFHAPSQFCVSFGGGGSSSEILPTPSECRQCTEAYTCDCILKYSPCGSKPYFRCNQGPNISVLCGQ